MEKTVQITARFVDPGLASHALQVAESDTVDDLRRQLLAHGVVKRGTSFGLKMSGKRKQIALLDDSKTLKDLAVLDGSVFTIEPLEADSSGSGEEDAVFDDAYAASSLSVPSAETVPSKHVSADPPHKRQKSSTNTSDIKKPVIACALGSPVDDMSALVRCFLTPDKISSADRLGEMTFNMFTSAARYSALQNPKRDLSLSLVNSSESSRLVVKFKSGKNAYQDSCVFYDETVLTQLVVQVYENTTTRSRKSSSSCRGMFKVQELASRAPYVLWSCVHMYGSDLWAVEHGISQLLDLALKPFE